MSERGQRRADSFLSPSVGNCVQQFLGWGKNFKQGEPFPSARSKAGPAPALKNLSATGILTLDLTLESPLKRLVCCSQKLVSGADSIYLSSDGRSEHQTALHLALNWPSSSPQKDIINCSCDKTETCYQGIPHSPKVNGGSSRP